jgi:hypothetical protein
LARPPNERANLAKDKGNESHKIGSGGYYDKADDQQDSEGYRAV